MSSGERTVSELQALLGILRFIPIGAPSVGPRFAHDVLLGFGLFSVAVAVPFILVQRDLKRLLATDRVELKRRAVEITA